MVKQTFSFLALLLVPAVLLSHPPGLQMRGEAKAGKAIHEKHCQRCHGEQGKGDGPSAKKIKNMKMADWTNKELMGKLTDQDLHQIIAGGGAAVGKSRLMPAYKDKLTEKEIADVLAFIRSLTQN